MAQEDLIPFNELTEEEQKKLASKGGKASVKARREKKKMKEQLDLLLSLPNRDDATKKKLKKMGVDIDNIDNQMAMILSMYQKAIGGDVQAATFIRDTIGEKAVEKVDVAGAIPVVISGDDSLED